MKKRLVLGTAGHIDHGKTALIRALTGVDADRLPEEKRRGMTIDLGFADVELPDCRLGIVDVPGHERFIKNMLAGATAIDMALLVVAADDSVMPQTREHVAILDLLRVSAGVVAITKADLRDREWLELVREEIVELLADTPLAAAPIVMTSAPAQGEPSGIEELRVALNQAATRIDSAGADELFRMCIDRVFSVPGRGTVVTGAVSSGEIGEGAAIELLPQGRELTIRGLQSHGAAVPAVQRGARAAVNLSGVHHTELARGDVLATPGYLRPSHVLTLELKVLRDAPWPVKHRGRYTLHLGAQAVPARVYLVEGSALAPGQQGVAQLHVAEPCVAVFDQPFVLRNESPVATVGGGRILQPCAKVVRRGRAEDVERLRQLAGGQQRRRVELAIRAFGAGGWTLVDLRRDAGLQQTAAQQIVAQLQQDGCLIRLADDHLVHAEVVAGIELRILKAVDALHAARPLSLWLPRPQVAERLQGMASEGVLDALIERLIAEGELQADPQGVKRASHEPQLTEKQRSVLQQILATLKDGGMHPPMAPELATSLECEPAELSALLQLLVEQGEAVFVGPNLFLDTACAARLRQTVADALRAQGEMTVAEIRDLLGVSRKYAVPICEYLDRGRITQRRGDVRRLHPSASDANASGD